jgi:hypothetical protein
MQLLLDEQAGEAADFRHVAPGFERPANGGRGRERWVVNKLRALCAWYSKGVDGGGAFRGRLNTASSLAEVRDLVDEYFFRGQAELAPQDESMVHQAGVR